MTPLLGVGEHETDRDEELEVPITMDVVRRSIPDICTRGVDLISLTRSCDGGDLTGKG